jgi:N utilization substance protein B
VEAEARKSMTRHALRDRVFGLVFRIEFYPKDELEEQIESYIESSQEEFLPEDLEYIVSKFRSVADKIEEVDAAIDKCAVGWTRSRMGKCELAALRLGIYEMLYDDDIPVSVAMDEAVEIAKTYGDATGGAFVNAILTKVKEQYIKA